MRYSVVIPTHNRLRLLADGVETIRDQLGTEAELVVFDNASDEPISDYVKSLNDPRIRCERSDAFLAVTDSWNSAINLARGDYVIFLGDDDALTPDYFSRMDAIIRGFHEPEIIYTAIYQFMHPGVAPWDPAGYIADVKNGFFFGDHEEPFLLSRDQASQAVCGSLDFSRNFTFNIQAFVFSRAFLQKLAAKGPIFQSPFPDYYLANVVFALAQSVVVVPSPMAIAGVSTASYGYTLFNGLEQKGDALLNSKLANDPVYPQIKDKLLPGPSYITNYAVTMEYVARVTEGVLHKPVNYNRYRRLQIYSTLLAVQRSLPEAVRWPDLRRRLKPAEWLWALLVKIVVGVSSYTSVLERAFAKATAMSHYSFQPAQRVCDRGGFSTATDFYRALSARTIR
jgi:hypothetical protein